jgi:hypothetical protein
MAIISIFIFLNLTLWVSSKSSLNDYEFLKISFFKKEFPTDSSETFANDISPIEEIQPGMGYSSDTQSLAKAVCYKTETIIRSGQSSILKFEQSTDYQSFLKTFNLEFDIKGGYGIFSTNDFYKFFHSIEEDSYSFSINYFQKVSQNVMMTFSYNPKTILTEVGENIYSSGANPMLRLLCGDTLISTYEEGAILILSLRINFNSKEEKEEFTTHVGLNIGSFIDASSTISNVSTKYNLSGRIQVLAFQIGGDPTELSKLLASSVVDCDIKNIKACQDTAKNLINYVSNIFPSQFKKDDHGIWMSPLVPLTLFKKDYLVSDFGLILAPSYLTKEVQNARTDLVNIKRKLDYYYSNLLKLKQIYPTKLDSPFSDYLSVLENNFYVLEIGDGMGRAIDCFQFPFKCLPIYDELKSKLILNYENDLMKSIQELEYFSVFDFAFNKYECLPTDYYWTDPWILHITVYPIGNGKFRIINSPSDLEYVQNEVSNLGNFNFVMKNDYISYVIDIKSPNFSDDVFTSSLICKENKMGVNQTFSLRGRKKKTLSLFDFYKE